MGMSSSRLLYWQDRATDNKFMLLDWIKGGSSALRQLRSAGTRSCSISMIPLRASNSASSESG